MKLSRTFFVLFLIVLVSCTSTQPVVRTTKPAVRKTPTKVTGTHSRKPVGRTVAVTNTNRKSAPVAVSTTSSKRESAVEQKKTSGEMKSIEEKYEAAKESNKSNSNQTVYSKTEILEATTRVKVTTAMVLDYIETYKEVSKNNMRQYGIPASIILGQGILESGAGTGPLSILANNHFGIKCHKDWTGPSVNYDDDEEQECFRKYDVAIQSYQDHALFLVNRPWYRPLFDLEKDDYKLWAKGLKNAGYATDPKYPEKLIAIIERYQLNQYDAQVLGKDFVVQNTASKPLSLGGDFYEVVPGDTLYSISKKFNISIDDLKRNNNMSDNTISIGQNLKVN